MEGCTSVELRRRMLLKDRTLDEIEEIASSIEGVDSQIQVLSKPQSSGSAEQVFKVREKPLQKFRPYASSSKSFGARQNNRFSNVVCFNCGKSGHISSAETCPARGKQCRHCNRVGHFESKCKVLAATKKSGKFPTSSPSRKVRRVEGQEAVREATDTTSDKVYYAFFSGNSSNILKFDVGGVPLDMLVDSGADANLVTVEAWERMKLAGVVVSGSAREANRTFLSYGSSEPLLVRGTFSAVIGIGNRNTSAEFYVVEKGQTCLLGDSTAKQLQVLKVGVDVNHVSKVEPFACIKVVEVHIHMQPQAKPIVQPVRRLPIPLEAEVNRKLEDMLTRDIIEPKTGPTSWVSPLVVVAKANGGLRLCVDLRRVNQAVMRERHPVWSKLDVQDSFLQVMIAAESRDILTFITDKGLF